MAKHMATVRTSATPMYALPRDIEAYVGAIESRHASHDLGRLAWACRSCVAVCCPDLALAVQRTDVLRSIMRRAPRRKSRSTRRRQGPPLNFLHSHNRFIKHQTFVRARVCFVATLPFSSQCRRLHIVRLRAPLVFDARSWSANALRSRLSRHGWQGFHPLPICISVSVTHVLPLPTIVGRRPRSKHRLCLLFFRKQCSTSYVAALAPHAFLIVTCCISRLSCLWVGCQV